MSVSVFVISISSIYMNSQTSPSVGGSYPRASLDNKGKTRMAVRGHDDNGRRLVAGTRNRLILAAGKQNGCPDFLLFGETPAAGHAEFGSAETNRGLVCREKANVGIERREVERERNRQLEGYFSRRDLFKFTCRPTNTSKRHTNDVYCRVRPIRGARRLSRFTPLTARHERELRGPNAF